MPDPLGLGLPPAPPVVSPSQKLIIGIGNVTLSPGTYVGGIVIAGKGSVTLLPGVYYMQGGGFSAIGQGSVTGTGVLIVNGPSKSGKTGSINLAGQGQVTLSASTVLTGAYAPYNGIAIFQDPHSSAPINVAGVGLTITGRMYAPLAPLNVTLLPVFGIPGSVVDTFSNAADPTHPGAIIVSTASVTGKGVSLRINV